MSEDILEKYLKAGEIACRVRKLAEQIVKPGIGLLEIAVKLENEIRALGGNPAFPVNISINEVAAHYTPVPRDSLVVPENSVVKVDIGVHVDGYIADTATTIVFDPRYERLAEATREALEKALKIVKPGTRFSEVGRVIEGIIKSYGYRPILNLSGHSLDAYTVHAGDVIPNYRDIRNFGRFREGRAYAIEPFATNGIGLVDEAPTITIYALRYNPKKLKNLDPEARALFERIYNERKTLPFALRWYGEDSAKLINILRRLSSAGLLIEYPVLVERTRGMVAQFEHTVFIYRSSVYVTTTPC